MSTHLPAAAAPPATDVPRRRGKGWLLLVPGMLWLAVFFLFPAFYVVTLGPAVIQFVRVFFPLAGG